MKEQSMRPNKIYHGDALKVLREWPDGCIDMVVTSPPYWGLRDYGIPGQLGLEKTPEEYIEKMVAVFREVRRVLRPWGTVWLNLGDSYANANRRTDKRQGFDGNEEKYGQRITGGRVRIRGHPTLKDKDLCMMPARVALALQADGWWLRSDIIWAKPNPMPESVTDRPTSSYEHVFLLTKSAKYFYDAEAVQETSITGDNRKPYGSDGAWQMDGRSKWEEGAGAPRKTDATGRNLRNVWTITTQPYPEAHYATFPEELPRRCILAGTSAKGNCAECGRPWVRVVESKGNYEKREAAHAPRSEPSKVDSSGWRPPTKIDKGWQPSCKCAGDTVPAVVLDPFFGSGTVGKVATDLGRNWLGIDINPEYIEQAKRRTAMRGLHEAV